MDQLTVGKLLMKVGELPVLPEVTYRVIKLTEDPAANPADLSTEISRDHVLASKVLKLVNSAYYGLPRKTATVAEAITILGMEVLRSLVIGTTVMQTLNDLPGEKAIDPVKTSQHALASAVAGKMIAAELGIWEKNHAFTAGLLHDIGKTVLSSLLYKEYRQVLEWTETRGCTMVEAERMLLRTDHAEIGRMVATKWNLPPCIVEPIGYHHNPFHQAEASDLCKVVYLADAAAGLAGYGIINNHGFSVDQAVFQQCRFNYSKLNDIAEILRETLNTEQI